MLSNKAQYIHIILSADDYEKFDTMVWDEINNNEFSYTSGQNPMTYYAFEDDSFVAFDDTQSNKRISIHFRKHGDSAFIIHKGQ